jgi:CHAT domain-containing protein
MKQDIIPHLRDCTIFHFAGHGHSDSQNPLDSKLLLDDSSSDPLTVTSLFDTKLHDSPPFLAYLSACGTGRLDNERFSDEGIHLISACQLAGFRHVVGTLWEVNDKSCVDMARVLYERLRDHGITDEAVSRGLHAAARHLRDEWSKELDNEWRGRGLAGNGKRKLEQVEGDGQRYIISCEDDDDMRPLYWVPFIHYGI